MAIFDNDNDKKNSRGVTEADESEKETKIGAESARTEGDYSKEASAEEEDDDEEL